MDFSFRREKGLETCAFLPKNVGFGSVKNRQCVCVFLTVLHILKGGGGGGGGGGEGGSGLSTFMHLFLHFSPYLKESGLFSYQKRWQLPNFTDFKNCDKIHILYVLQLFFSSILFSD